MRLAHLIIGSLCLFLFSCDGENVDVFTPEIITNQATDITADGALLNGTLIKLGSSQITLIGFEYTQDAAALANDNGERVKLSINTTTVPLNFEHILSGLTTATEYHFRTYAITANGESYGDIFSFSTE